MRGTDFTEQASLIYSGSQMNLTSSFGSPNYIPQADISSLGFALPQLSCNLGILAHQDSMKENLNNFGIFSTTCQQANSSCIDPKFPPSFSLSTTNSFVSTQNIPSFDLYSANIDSAKTLQYEAESPTINTPDQLTPLYFNQRSASLQRNFEAYYQVLNIMPYQDDEPIAKYAPAVPIESCLNLSIETYATNTYIDIKKTQAIPVKVSMSLSPTELYARPPLDIICVIEKSQEVGPSFMESVRISVHNLLNVLNDNDRLSVVFYDDFGHRATALNRMNEDNKEVVRDAMHDVYLSGGVDMADGLGQAMEIIRQRKYINSTTCVFLFGASNDTKSLDALEFLFQKYANEKFYVHSFGFPGYNNQVLQWIANRKNGAFYNFENEKELSNSFFEALTSLSSLQSHEIELYFFTNTKINPETTFSTVKNCDVTCSIPEKCYKVKIPFLNLGCKQEFYLEIAVPEINPKVLKGAGQSVNILDVICRMETFDNVITKKENLQIQIYSDLNDESTVEQEQEDDQREIMFEEFRSEYTSNCIQEINSSFASIEKVNKLVAVEMLMIEANKYLQQNKMREAKILASRLRREAQGLGMEFEVVIKNFLERVYQSCHTESFEDLIE